MGDVVPESQSATVITRVADAVGKTILAVDDSSHFGYVVFSFTDGSSLEMLAVEGPHDTSPQIQFVR